MSRTLFWSIRSAARTPEAPPQSPIVEEGVDQFEPGPEASFDLDRKGLSIPDRYAHIPGSINNDDNGDVANDHRCKEEWWPESS